MVQKVKAPIDYSRYRLVGESPGLKSAIEAGDTNQVLKEISRSTVGGLKSTGNSAADVSAFNTPNWAGAKAVVQYPPGMEAVAINGNGPIAKGAAQLQLKKGNTGFVPNEMMVATPPGKQLVVDAVEPVAINQNGLSTVNLIKLKLVDKPAEPPAASVPKPASDVPADVTSARKIGSGSYNNVYEGPQGTVNRVPKSGNPQEAINDYETFRRANEIAPGFFPKPELVTGTDGKANAINLPNVTLAKNGGFRPLETALEASDQAAPTSWLRDHADYVRQQLNELKQSFTDAKSYPLDLENPRNIYVNQDGKLLFLDPAEIRPLKSPGSPLVSKAFARIDETFRQYLPSVSSSGTSAQSQ